MLAASLYLAGAKPDAVLVVLPSDHVIEASSIASLRKCTVQYWTGLLLPSASNRAMPKGYGYVMDGGQFDLYPGLHRVESFIEKPSTAHCTICSSTPSFAYWASGISMFRASKLIEEYRRLDPSTFAAVSAALQSASPLETEAGLLLDERHFIA